MRIDKDRLSFLFSLIYVFVKKSRSYSYFWLDPNRVRTFGLPKLGTYFWLDPKVPKGQGSHCGGYGLGRCAKISENSLRSDSRDFLTLRSDSRDFLTLRSVDRFTPPPLGRSSFPWNWIVRTVFLRLLVNRYATPSSSKLHTVEGCPMDNSYNKGSCGFALKKFYIPCISIFKLNSWQTIAQGIAPGYVMLGLQPISYSKTSTTTNWTLSIVNCQFIWHGLQQWKIENWKLKIYKAGLNEVFNSPLSLGNARRGARQVP